MLKKTATNHYINYIYGPLRKFILRGLSPKKLCVSLAFGITLGVIPVFGVSTILGALTALILKLNLPVIQLANFTILPVKLTMMIPYYYLGDWLFNSQQTIDLNILKNILVESKFGDLMILFFDATLYAIGAWLILSPVIAVISYAGFKPIIFKVCTNTAFCMHPSPQP